MKLPRIHLWTQIHDIFYIYIDIGENGMQFQWFDRFFIKITARGSNLHIWPISTRKNSPERWNCLESIYEPKSMIYFISRYISVKTSCNFTDSRDFLLKWKYVAKMLNICPNLTRKKSSVSSEALESNYNQKSIISVIFTCISPKSHMIFIDSRHFWHQESNFVNIGRKTLLNNSKWPSWWEHSISVHYFTI